MARRRINTTKCDIIKVATEKYLTEGYSATTMKAIYDELNISTGNLTFYFPTKEHLLSLLIKMLCRFQWRKMRELTEDGTTPMLALCLELATVAACCGEAVERVAHSLSGASYKSGATCAACGYTDGVLSAHTYENDCTAICAVCEKATRAESFHADKNGDGACDLCGAEVEKKRISGGGVSAIVTGSTVVAGAGGFSLFWFVIRKKSLAQLLMLLK